MFSPLLLHCYDISVNCHPNCQWVLWSVDIGIYTQHVSSIAYGSVRCMHHDWHTCSEQSLRILMWNASYVQKRSLKPDRKSMKTRSEKNLEVCISTSLLDANRSLPDIKFGLKIVWKRHAGSWLSRLPLTKNWKIAGKFSQEHCSVFVGRWLQCSPAAPCSSRSFTTIQMPCKSRSFTSTHRCFAHTHPPAGGWEN